MDNRPIGIFDSGVGGLTVAKEVMENLPNERIVYFGDTARVPYGSKSRETVTKYSAQIIRFLLTKDVKAIIIACNTASSNSLEIVQDMFDLPILGVVRPGVKAGVALTRNKKIGVIGTEATIKSRAYQHMIVNTDKEIQVFEKACPLFVPLVEEGWIEEKVSVEIAKRYLEPLIEKEIDALILGCTHYPLLKKTIRLVVGKDVQLVDPALESSLDMKKVLQQRDILGDMKTWENEFYVSDMAEKFEIFAKRILKRPMRPVQQIDIEEY